MQGPAAVPVAPADPEAPPSPGLPAALCISLGPPAASGSATPDATAERGVPAAGTESMPGCPAAVAAPPRGVESSSGQEAAARAVDDEMPVAEKEAGAAPVAERGDAPETPQTPAPAATLKAAVPGPDHPAAQLARKILADMVATPAADNGSVREGLKDAAPGPASPSTALPAGSLSVTSADTAPLVNRPAGGVRGRAVAADGDRAMAPVAPFLVSAGETQQDSRGGTSRGGHAWPSFWPAMADAPRAGARASGGGAGLGLSVPAFAEPATVSASLPPSAAAAGGAVTTMGQSPLPDAEMSRQVVRAVTLAWRDQVGEARLHLTPEHLGEVTVSLRVERGMVSAVLQADTAAARDWIRLHENELRQGLEGQGLHLDSLVVTDDGAPQGRQEQQAPRKRPQGPARHSTDRPRFEIRV